MKQTKLALVAGIIAAATMVAPAHAAPGDMSVATFLAKVDALKAKGIMAMLSSDVGVLKAEATAAGYGYRDRLKKERAAGHPSSCPPTPTKVSQLMWLNHLSSYPAAQRGQTTLNRAMSDMFSRNWPCRK